MADPFDIVVDGRPVHVDGRQTLAAALVNARCVAFRRSQSGEARWPICGMGVCFECRVTIDGEPHRRACLELCTPGMVVTTSA